LFSALALSLKCRSFGIFLSVKVSIVNLLEPNWNQFRIKPPGPSTAVEKDEGRGERIQESGFRSRAPAV
jgi:hypothetical protein